MYAYKFYTEICKENKVSKFISNLAVPSYSDIKSLKAEVSHSSVPSAATFVNNTRGRKVSS